MNLGDLNIMGAATDLYHGMKGALSDGSSGAPYVPQNLNQVAGGLQGNIGAQTGIAMGAQQAASPWLTQSLNQGEAINYNPYLQASQQAGAMYPWLSQMAGQQGAGYGTEAALAQGQQGNLYGAGMDTYLAALDPQNALYNRTAQQLTDQINAGQALRGLGNSPVGAAEYNQAMGNFNMDWQNQQLQRQINALQAMSTASNAGATQGQLYGQDLADQMAAYGAMPGYIQQGASVPLSAEQYVAAQPGAVASQYLSGMSGMQGLYGAPETAGQNYLNTGVSGSQQAASYNTAQQQGLGNLLGTGLMMYAMG